MNNNIRRTPKFKSAKKVRAVRKRNNTRQNDGVPDGSQFSVFRTIPITPYITMSSVKSTVQMKSTGQVLDATSPFVVCETPLNGPSLFAMTGGTGAINNVVTGLGTYTPFALGRVLRIACVVNLSSFESVQDLQAVLIFSDTQPSTVITTYSLACGASRNYMSSRCATMGINSGQSKSGPLFLNSTCRRILCDQMIADDRDFVATLNPAPVPPNQELWMALILFNSVAATNITFGCSLNAEFTFLLHGFSRLPGM